MVHEVENERLYEHDDYLLGASGNAYDASLLSINDEAILNERLKEEKDKILKEMLLNKKIPNESFTGNGVPRVDERIYKDLSVNKGDTFNQNSESIIKRKIIQYRELARNPELDDIIRDIVNEAVITDGYDTYPVKIQINSDTDFLKTIQDKSLDKIYKLFTNILEKLNFDIEGVSIFERWFVDGRLYVWRKRTADGTTASYEILDPVFLTLKESEDENAPPVYEYLNVDEMPVLAEGTNFYGSQFGNASFSQGMGTKTSSQDEFKLEIPYEDVIPIFSGIYDALMKFYISPIEKAMKILNQLNNLEDAMVLYQFIRAVPRRIFKIDTGSLPPKDREAYLNQVQRRHRESLTLKYDTNTGEIKGDDRVRFLSLFDDYWVSTFEGDKTDIGPLDTNTQEWDTITEKLNYFRRKLYRAMNVPFSRYDSQQNDSSEYKLTADSLQRQERKYQKYIMSLRKTFSELFYNLLKKEAISEKVLTEIEWALLSKRLFIDWEDDNYFTQFKKYDILGKQVDIIGKLEGMIGKFYTIDYIHREVLNRNDEEIEQFKQQIAKEKSEMAEFNASGGGGGSGMPGEDIFGGGGGGGGAPDLSGLTFEEPALETPPEPTAEPTPPAETAPTPEL